MDRMTNHEYDQQYRQHMEKVQRQAQYINDLLRYSSLQDQARSSRPQYHRSHVNVPMPRHATFQDLDDDDVSEIIIPVKPKPKPLKPILRRTVSSTVATTQPQSTSARRRPISDNQARQPQYKERIPTKDFRKVRIQESHDIAYYPHNHASDDEDEEEEEEEEELWYDERQTYRQPSSHQHTQSYQSESEEDDIDSYSSNEPRVQPSPSWGRASPPPRRASQSNHNDTANHRYPAQRLENYLKASAVSPPLHHRQQQPAHDYAGSGQSTPTANNAVTSMLEQFFTKTPSGPVLSSTVSSPISSQGDAMSFPSSPRTPSYSSSTSASNSSTNKSFLSSIFRKGPTSPPNVIATRPPQRLNAKRSELLSPQDMAEIRDSTRYDAGEVRSGTPAKDRKAMKVASLSQVWCFRIWSQPQHEEETPVWTAFDYNNQKKITKAFGASKECHFRDSHLQGDVLVLPTHNTGQVFEGNNSIILEVRQISVQQDTMFVYREGVRA
ncbi:hypothetical protein BC943DRAFT_325265 [Umbelopsis sp. AD052]|nr:hypothetical protein BC943DRAFT_325265 [Umbelopsis sp. AD052]